LQISIATFGELENDNSTSHFSQGFTPLVHSSSTTYDYQLLDFGQGRKLEQLGQVIVDRPCPGANGPKRNPKAWQSSQLVYREGPGGGWDQQASGTAAMADIQDDWECRSGGIRLGIRPTVAGQLGVFPEHWAHWDWLRESLSLEKQAVDQESGKPRVLSLFAYTGATTLALALSGCDVTHVDASKPTVQWARENAVRSGLQNASIRWIVDDASAFVKRDLRRKQQYDAIILDPPTYGHGSQGDRWQIRRDLVPLLSNCWQLLSENRKAVLLCGHSSHISIRDINQVLVAEYGRKGVGRCEVSQAFLVDLQDRKLDCGFSAKYSWK
jgi:23S rRNA (cytosine1962-C5)-methyltransferase